MENKVVRGYKVFNPDWTCNGFQYEVGKTYTMEESPICCERGFHFCEKLEDCFNYYEFSSENKVAEIEASGEIVTKGNKSCTNKIRIVRDIPWEEVLHIVNTGHYNTGICNTGNRNTGDWNTGDWNTGNLNTGHCNTGNRNTGDCNTGNRNTGDWNTGDWNTGDRNTGDCNTGNRNTGDWNTGDWNTTSHSSGLFNTKEEKIRIFNKPSDWSYKDWTLSGARILLNKIDRNVVEWICEKDMTEQEKKENPTYKTTGGYLKVLDESECTQMWWDDLTESEKDIIRNLPNFDNAIFEQITGIKTGFDKEE